ncbi:hypothetical protein ACWGRK_05460 [Saccharomonospora azurea]|uniref:Uncharacterized protein n=1 Tax=Saccharomonospora azurea NA-128 TaxID=882081 RepID=H8G4P8_9PSEU|nr:hypothetical protein [Saccharomonospora azurea]EHK87405.1 hypothetical protein SZMC14600_10708 [Saccharomonospora azurea SZMC 14600]EHY89151.1 hypothetical protein SacazDRAFT_02240 [Saccharomonospora azurea NA-128]
MLWLFGEIWLWLFAAFVLGLALAGATYYAMRRRTTADGDRATGPTAPPLSDTERTTLMRRVDPDHDPAHGARRPPYGTEDAPAEGRLHGVLPLTPSEWRERNDWPDERDIAIAEENRPRPQG